MKLKLFISFFIIVFALFNFSLLLASEDKVSDDWLLVETDYLNNGQSIDFFTNQFKLSAPAGALTDSTLVTAKKILAPFAWPWNFQPLSPVYEFDLVERGQNYNRQLPLSIEIAYTEKNDYYKQIFFLDGNSNRWRALPSVDYPDQQVIKTKLHFPFVRLAVLYTKDVPTVGEASWYAFRGGLFAASPDFPRGSVIRVHNLVNHKFVDVVINDYGPDRSIFPDRIIDLDKVAFEQIASTRDGLIEVKLEPRHLALAADDHVFRPGPSQPAINARSAIIISEKDSTILFTKEASQVAPLASLTKLVAVRVFLDLGISLDKEVTYLDQDEKYNHVYVQPWESARLRITGGEALTVRDLIHVAVIGSANNIMETLVRASQLPRQEFIARMNIFAEVWGARNTNFVEPTGLSRDNVSSPLDYAIIIKEILKNPLLAEISNQTSYSFSTVNTNRSFRVGSTNQLLLYSQLPLASTKTGFINASGHCLFSRFKAGEDNLIIVTFASDNRQASYNDHEQLFRYGLRQLKNQ